VSVIRCCRSLLPAVGRCCCCHRCCQPRWRGGLSGHKHALHSARIPSPNGASARPVPSRPQPWSLCAALPPIGLTAAYLFAGGKGSRADLRVRKPGIFTCACCPAAGSALDAVPEAYHNPAAVWWGSCTFAANGASNKDHQLGWSATVMSSPPGPKWGTVGWRAGDLRPWRCPGASRTFAAIWPDECGMTAASLFPGGGGKT
jgi:hypothetical protein